MVPTGEVRGIESFKNVLAMFRSAVPDLHIIVEDQIQENDKVVTRFVLRATQRRLDGDSSDRQKDQDYWN